MRRTSIGAALVLTLAGCATLDQPDPSNVAAYCTRDNAVRLGSQGRAYFGGCPKDRESAFRDGLAYGRSLRYTPAVWPYYERMRQTEDEIVAVASEPQREPLRARLRDLEWWAIHILNTPGTYSVDN
jgi:Protein of unknown function (DUF2799)